MSRPPMVGRAFLDVVGLGPLEADALAHAQPLEQADEGRHEHDHDGEGDEDALDDGLAADHARASPAPAASTRRSTSRSSAAPREALTSTCHRPAARPAEPPGPRPGRRRRSTRGGVKAAARWRRRRSPLAPSPTTTSRGPAIARLRRPTRWCSAAALSAQLEHLAEHGDMPPRQLCEEVQSGQDRVGRSVVGIVEDASSAPARTSCERCGIVQRAREAGDDVGDVHARRGRPRPPRRARCGRHGGPARA